MGEGERGYLELVRRALSEGERRRDRTGVGTLALFGERLTHNLRGGRLPLLTTKKVFWRGVVEELAWFLRGSTRESELSERGVRIWAPHAALAGDDLGPIYGHQWRRWGSRRDPEGRGLDQLAALERGLRENPHGRRHLVTAWNPSDVPDCALPPCHCLFQMYVHDPEGPGRPAGLSCHVYQRSADLGLGVPFNAASYGLLTHVLAARLGVARGEPVEARQLTHSFGDVHVYLDHRSALSEQLTREPFPGPRVRVLDPGGWSLEELTPERLELTGYLHHPALPMQQAV